MKYEIKYSIENSIGGAYDEHHHEIAQIAPSDDSLQIEFRSSNYLIDAIKDEHGAYEFKVGNDKRIRISLDGEDIIIESGDKKVDCKYPDFSYQLDNGDFSYHFADDENLEIVTESEEIVEPIALGLALIAFVHQN